MEKETSAAHPRFPVAGVKPENLRPTASTPEMPKPMAPLDPDEVIASLGEKEGEDALEALEDLLGYLERELAKAQA